MGRPEAALKPAPRRPMLFFRGFKVVMEGSWAWSFSSNFGVLGLVKDDGGGLVDIFLICCGFCGDSDEIGK